MVSKYGEKFVGAVDKTVKVKTGWRTAFLIFAIVAFVPLFALYMMFTMILSDDIAENAVRLLIAFGAPFAFLISIVLYVALNKRGAIITYKRVTERTLGIARYLGEDTKALQKEFKAHRKAKDKKWIIDTANKYYDECERLKAEKLVEHAAEKAEKGEGGFDGWMIQKWAWMLLGLIVTVATLGICFPVAYVWILKWEAKHSLYDGKRLSFDGKASSLVGKWIGWILLVIPTIGIYALFIPKKLLQWKASHTHIEGEMSFLGGTWDGSAILLILNKIGCSLFSAITLGTLKPIAICWRKRFIQNRLMIDGRPMSFDGNGAEILGKWIGWTLLTYITFGIYSLFRNARVLNWVNKHTHIEAEIKQIKVI